MDAEGVNSFLVLFAFVDIASSLQIAQSKRLFSYILQVFSHYELAEASYLILARHSGTFSAGIQVEVNEQTTFCIHTRKQPKWNALCRCDFESR